MVRLITTAFIMIAAPLAQLHAAEKTTCKTETGSFWVIGKGPGGKAANCKTKEICYTKVIEGRCQQFFGCKTYVNVSYSNCEAAAQRAPTTKVEPKITPRAAETPGTKSPKVLPKGGIQQN